MRIRNKDFIGFVSAIVFVLGLFVWSGLSAVADDKGVNFTYEIDMNATNSGATTTQGNRTIKDIQNLVGTSKICTLVLKHSGSGVTKACVISSGVTLTDNFYLDIRPGAEFTLNANLIVASRGHVKIAEGQTLKGGGTGALLYTSDDETRHGWKKLEGCFNAIPTTTSSLTMLADRTALILPGMSLKYVISGITTCYGIVDTITANTLALRGAPLSGNVTALYYDGGTIREFIVNIPGTYEDATNTGLIRSDLNYNFYWRLPKSYLVFFTIYSETHDSGTHGQADVTIDGYDVYTTAGGPTIAADDGQYGSGVSIAVGAYDINASEIIEISCVKGGVGDATNLSVTMVFVTP